MINLLSSERAKLIQACREAMVCENYDEAWHSLYMFALSYSDDPYDAWKGIEQAAKEVSNESP